MAGKAKATTLEQDFDRAPSAGDAASAEAADDAAAAAERKRELLVPNDGEPPPGPETVAEFLGVDEGTALARVREQYRSDRYVYFATRENYQHIMSDGGDFAIDLVKHMIPVDSAAFVRMNADDNYLLVHEKTGQIVPKSQIVKVYIPKYENFDDPDLEMVAASRDIDASQMTRDQLVARLQTADDHRLTIDAQLAQ